MRKREDIRWVHRLNVGCCGYESTVSHLYDKAQSIITELHQILPTFEITYGNRSSAKLRDSSLLRFLASCKLFQHHLLGLVKIIREYLLFGLMPLVSFLGPKSKAVTKVAHSRNMPSIWDQNSRLCPFSEF